MTQNKTINKQIEELKKGCGIKIDKIKGKFPRVFSCGDSNLGRGIMLCRECRTKLSTLQEAKDEIEDAQRECGKAINEAIINRRKLDIEEFEKMIDEEISFWKAKPHEPTNIVFGLECLKDKLKGEEK